MIVPFTILKHIGVSSDVVLIAFASLVGGLVFYNIDRYIFRK